MIKKILIFTRPWEVRFHMALGKKLSNKLHVPVEFATFFSKAKHIIETESTEEYKVYYMPQLLRDVELEDFNDDYFKKVDILLKEKIGVNFNIMINAERFLPKDENGSQVFYKRHFLVLDSLIQEGTLAISSFIDHYVYWLASGLAWVKNGCYFAHCTIGMPPNYSVFYKHPRETWKKDLSLELSESIKQYSLDKLNIPTMKRVDYAIVTSRPGMLRRFTHTLKDIEFEKIDENYNSYFQYYAPYKSRIFGHIGNALKKLKPSAKRICDINTPNDLPKQFIYYPLHYEPEATIFMLSPYFRDQIEASRIMAQSLPVGVKLVIKDHPQMYALRDSEYYDKLRAIPNILLCSPLIEGKVLTEKCNGVVSLSGTAAIEAFLLGKNNLCLGWPPFGMALQYQNFSENNHLIDLYNIFSAWIRTPKATYDANKWNDWCSRLCNVSLVPKNNGYEHEIIDDAEKSDKVVSHIYACLEYEGII